MSAAVAPVAAQDEPTRLIVGVAQEPDSLNIFNMVLSISYTINFLVYDTLTSVEPDLRPGPQLATSWDVSADNLTWTFHLNPNAVWHDGEAVTSEDVKFTFELIKNNPKECALWIDYLTNVTLPIETPDENTVIIHTEVPKATMLSIMIPILPEHIWESVDVKDLSSVDPFDDFPQGKPIGSGPLILEEWDSILGHILMTKNPDYFLEVDDVRQVVKVDEVLFKTFGEVQNVYESLVSGDIDVAMEIPTNLWDETLEETGIQGQATPALSFYELGINCASEEWREAFQPQASDNLETTNLSVRQAIGMVTDKDYIVSNIMLDLADPGESIIPTATPFWHYNVTPEERWDFNVDAANALLDAAGYDLDDDDDNIRENSTSGVELDFSLYYRKGYPDEAACAQKLHDWLAEIGIGVTLMDVSEGVLWRTWMNCQYDLFIWGWDTDVDPNFMLSTMTESQYPVDSQDSTKWGDAFWINETYEEMYLEQQTAVDMYERQAIIFEMQKLLYYECPYVVLYYPMGLYAYDVVEYTNYPNMVDFPGTTPGTMWFYFAVTPSAEYVDLRAPENVNAGPDMKCTVGETLGFYGYAEDEDSLISELNWTWMFSEPDGMTFNERYGRSVSYTFENLGNVNVSLIVTDPDLLKGSDRLVVNVTEMSDTAGWLKGFVEDADGEPVVGANVTASDLVRITFGEGEYGMVIEAGTYEVNASRTGYTSATGEFTIVAGETTWANFTLSATTGTLEGVVYDKETGLVIASAEVVIVYSGKTKTFMTNAQGFYQFVDVDEGVVNVTVSKSGYLDNATDVEVTAGSTTVHDVYLDPEESGGTSNTLAIVAGIVIALIVLLAVVYMLMKKKSGGKPEEELLTSDEQVPPQT